MFSLDPVQSGNVMFPEISSTRSISAWYQFQEKSKDEQGFQAYTYSVIKFLVVGKKRFSSILLEN